MDIVREKNTSLLPIVFKDENGNSVTPSSATYQIDDIKPSGETEITPETAFTPGDILISANENRILDPSQASERRRVTIKWTYSGSKAGADEYFYLVKNLAKVN